MRNYKWRFRNRKEISTVNPERFAASNICDFLVLYIFVKINFCVFYLPFLQLMWPFLYLRISILTCFSFTRKSIQILCGFTVIPTHCPPGAYLTCFLLTGMSGCMTAQPADTMMSSRVSQWRRLTKSLCVGERRERWEVNIKYNRGGAIALKFTKSLHRISSAIVHAVMIHLFGA